MKHASPLVILVTLVALSAPAFAGTAGADLPRLSFPPEAPTETGQGCAAPATVSGTRCESTRE